MSDVPAARVYRLVRPYTSVLLGEQAASKTAGRGSTPRARA